MKKYRFNTYKLYTFSLLIVFYFLLSALYFTLIINYDDFNYVSYTQKIDFYFYWPRYIVASIVLLGHFYLLLRVKISDFTFSILLLVLFFFVIPSGLLFSSNAQLDPSIFVLHNTLFISIYLFSLIRWNLSFPKFSSHSTTTLLVAITLVGLIPFVISYGPYIDISNLWFVNVYETRALVLEKVDNLYTAYTYSWFSKVIIPTALIFCIYFRKRTLLVVMIISLLFLYLCGAHKTVFLGTLFMIVFYKYEYLKKMYYFMKLMTLLLIFSIVMTLLFDLTIIWEMTFRRALLLSALLDYCYFDFFDENYIYWSNSFMSRFIDYPYNISPDFIIGRDYFNRPEMNANVGIISDGFKNAGHIGALLNIFIVAIIFSFLNSLKISPKFFGLFILFLFSLLNSSLATILLTHGGFIMLIIAAFFLRDTNTTLKNVA